MSKVVTFAEGIRQATEELLTKDQRVHVFGLGATYRNGLDGTMGDLAERFVDRVHDTPCSEAAITGLALGAAVTGLRPVLHHGRVEFALYAANHILTEAANWSYMFGGYPAPLTIRIATGRQWGNGPAHTRVSRGLFAVPGLKVVVPSTPDAAKGLLLSAVDDDNPVLYLEPRWLYKVKGTVPEGAIRMPLDKARVLRQGGDITIVAVGDMVIEALHAAESMWREANIAAEVIDLVSVYPIDWQTIIASLHKTTRLLVVDATTPAYSSAHEVIAAVVEHMEPRGVESLRTLTCPDVPCPTAPSLTAAYYPTWIDVCNSIADQLGMPRLQCLRELTFEELHLAPTVNVDEYIREVQHVGNVH